MKNYPTELAPRIIAGEIHGPVRLESLDGKEMYWPEMPSGITSFEGVGPFEQDGKTWFVTHLQKKSKKGWLKTSPDCYHWWYTIRPQAQDKDGNWIPGTEKVIYFRKPFSWRFDVAGTIIDGVMRHWIWTKGYFGLHWD